MVHKWFKSVFNVSVSVTSNIATTPGGKTQINFIFVMAYFC